MKTITFLILIGISSFSFDKDCSDAYSAADDAYSYAKKAYNSDSWEDSKTYLKKAMSLANDAMSYSSDCECDDAYSAADDSYS